MPTKGITDMAKFIVLSGNCCTTALKNEYSRWEN